MSDKYFTITRASAGSIGALFSVAIRRMVSCQPSGVVRRYEMRDIRSLLSEAWHGPHVFFTVGFVIGIPSSDSGLAVVAGVGGGAVVWCRRLRGRLASERGDACEGAEGDYQRVASACQHGVSRFYHSDKTGAKPFRPPHAAAHRAR